MPHPILPPLAALALSIPGAAPAGPAPSIDVGEHHVVLEGERLAPRVQVRARGARVVSVRFDCDGDGRHEADRSEGCLFPSSGRRALSVEARDSRGRTARASVPVDVLNTAPWASIRAPRSLTAGQASRFVGVATDADPSDLLRYRWSFGDGVEAEGASPRHVFAGAGTYRVRLTVSDGEGGVTVSERDVQVRPAEAVLAAR